MTMTRRRFALGTGALAATVAAAGCAYSTAAPMPDFPVTHTDAQWRELLSADQFDVLRRAGTETPYSSPLDHELRRGTYTCAGCTSALFSSDNKFDSGTGWPSFWKPLNGALFERTDGTLGMPRTEVLCRHCGGHLGHVFDDGPQPTGLRYCMNGVAMNFRAL
ncbi:peptide-methionine (R)-S-oxide reductase MsrB [Mycobacterium sp. BMJ-28]